MRFYHVSHPHDSKLGWLARALARVRPWSVALNQRLSTWVGGCVLCGQATQLRGDDMVSPRLCMDCTEHLPHHLCTDETVQRCVQCAHLLATPDAHCLECLTEPPAFTHTVVFADYAEQMQHLILPYKFHNALHLAPALGDCLRHALRHYARSHTPDFIVLVPQLDAHTQSRGFNHLRLLMQHIDLAAIWPNATPRYLPDGVLRLHHGRLQIHVKPDQRRKQVKNAFSLPNPSMFEHAHVLLIDDIITTGATLNEIARQFASAGARQVDNVLIARTRRTPLK